MKTKTAFIIIFFLLLVIAGVRTNAAPPVNEILYNFNEPVGSSEVLPTPGTVTIVGTLEGSTGGPERTTVAISDKALLLNNDLEDYVSFSASPTYDTVVNNFSISTWVKVDDYTPVDSPTPHTTEFRVIASAGLTDDSGWLLYARKSDGNLKLFFQIKDGGTWMQAYSRNINPGQFYHVVGTYKANRNSGNLYIDGTQVSSLSGGAMLTPVTGNSFYIGGRIGPGLSPMYLRGIVDEFKVFLTYLNSASSEYDNQRPTVPTDPAVELLYNFDEGAGDTVNPSVDTLFGSREGAEWTTVAISRTALIFNNEEEDYVTFPISPTYSSGVNDFSVSTWVKVDNYTPDSPSGPTQFRVIASAGLSDNSGWLLYARMSDGNLKLFFQIKDGGTWMQAYSRNINPGQFYHVVGTYKANRNSGNLYIDGAQVSSLSGGAMLTPTVGDSFDIGGRRGRWPARHFSGVVDEFKIFGRELLTAEVGTEYDNQRPTVPTDPAVELLYNFDEGANNTINPSEGTLVGSLEGNADWASSDAFLGDALSFNGEGYLTFPTSPTYDATLVNDFSVSMWVKVDDYFPNPPGDFSQQIRVIASAGLTDDSGWLIYARKSGGNLKLFYQVKNGDIWLQAYSWAITPGQFYHVAATYNAGANSGKLYWNGTSAINLSTGQMVTPRLGDSFDIGGRRGEAVSAFYLSGVVDEFKIFGRKLLQVDVTAEYGSYF